MVSVIRRPMFLFGLAIRILLILLAEPLIHTTWFVPFIQHGLFGSLLDPWGAHLAAGGDPAAFPYGLPMFAIPALTVALGSWVDWLSGGTHGAQIGFGLTILVLDGVVLWVLLKFRPEYPQRLLFLYWLSPIVLYICYWHGHLDIIPVSLLVLAVYFISKNRPLATGLLMGVAIAAKLSMVIALPFTVVYLLNNKQLRHLLVPFCAAVVASFVLLSLPTVASSAAWHMVLGTPEMAKIFSLAVALDDHHSVYLLPTVYLLILFAAWRVHRMSFDLLVAFLGLAFFLVVIMTPAAPGWFLWAAPFFFINVASAETRVVVLAFGFSILFTGLHLLTSTGALLLFPAWDLTSPWTEPLAVSPHVVSLWLTGLIALGLMLNIRLIGEGILRTDYYRMTRRPVVLGIGGDSGTGKDTLADYLTALFGPKSVVRISGDDYHLWDRYRPMWQVLTHLNPQANDLPKFTQDVLLLNDGRAVRNRHYDHTTGRMTKPVLVRPNDVLIVSGLHALYSPALRERYDLSIFLDMDDGLRRFLKIRRDVGVRGHPLEKVLASLASREADRERFIQPQAEHADLIFTLLPLNPAHLEGKISPDTPMPRLRLRVLLRQGSHYEQLVRVLIGVCGMHVEVLAGDATQPVDITLEGDVDADDIAMAARELVPHLDDLICLEPIWQPGTGGLMQLFIVLKLSHALRRRLT